MKRENAHVPVLSLDKLRSLPEAEEFEGGIYFLWLKDQLQYVGKSWHIGERMNHHNWAAVYGHHRSNKTNMIPHDRHTCIVLDRGRIKDRTGPAGPLMKSYERAYIAHYTPPYNYIGGNSGT